METIVDSAVLRRIHRAGEPQRGETCAPGPRYARVGSVAALVSVAALARRGAAAYARDPGTMTKHVAATRIKRGCNDMPCAGHRPASALVDALRVKRLRRFQPRASIRVVGRGRGCARRMRRAEPLSAAEGSRRRVTPNDGWIGVLSPFLSGTYFSRVVSGIKWAAREGGLRVVAVQASPRDAYRLELARDRVLGWITIVDALGVERFLRDGVPVVLVSALSDLPCANVLPDNRGGALAAALHLIDHGHRRIAFIGNPGHEDVRQRFRAYREALEQRGIPFDAGLVIDVANNERPSGREGARRLLGTGAAFTAICFGTDQGALGGMEVLRASGRRIPEDVAVVGFDDGRAARFAYPPLSTVRQSFDLIGGTAARLVVDQLAGREVPCGAHYVPTTFVPRRSCGCSAEGLVEGRADAQARDEPGVRRASVGLERRAPEGDPDARNGSWEEALTRDLVDLVTFSVPIPPGMPAAAAWPGVACLIEGLRGAVLGTVDPTDSAIEQAFREAALLTPHLDTLLLLVDRLDGAGQALVQRTADPAAGARLSVFVKRMQRCVMRSRLALETERVEDLEALLDTNHAVSTLLMKSATSGTKKLGWLRDAEVRWACLGQWRGHAAGGEDLRIGEIYASDEDSSRLVDLSVPASSLPPVELLPASTLVDGEEIVRILLLGADDQVRGILAMSAPPNHWLTLDRSDLDRWATMLDTAVERALLVESLTEQQRLTHLAYERERALVDVVRELSCPVIPLLQQVLLVPLIGEIGPDRARQVLKEVLAGVSAHRAEVVLLDLTGVLLIDAEVAASLLKTARAVGLLGARVILVGLRPNIAQSVVRLGLDLGELASYRTLGAALEALSEGRRR